MMHPRALQLLPLFACACLQREISDYIDEVREPCTTGTTGTTSSSGSTSSSTAPDTSSTAGTTSTTEDTSSSDTTSLTSTSTTSTTSSDTGTTDEPGTSTGEPAPVCGNSIVEDLEDCDDGNDDPDDGCSDCGRDRTVFVSSKEYQGGILMGLFGADQLCRGHAAMAGLPDPVKYMAWLSDSQNSALDRMFHSRGRYVLVNGLVVAESWDALIAGPLENPINVNELSQTYDYGAWTSTNPDGTTAAGVNHCLDWTSSGPDEKSFVGFTSAVNTDWTLAEVLGPSGCGLEFALYCLEQQ